MCGINGIFAYGDGLERPDLTELLATRDQMAARGPDGAGVWSSRDSRTLLGHRRLTVVDVNERSNQPFLARGDRYVVVFNGEIYNHSQLRQFLEDKGFDFRTASDTEVLPYLYDYEGPAMVRRLRGMFAFAIWDCVEETLFLARDPFGIKPLYYSDDGSTFRFASQVKALVAGRRISATFDPAGVAGYFLWGSVPEPFSIYSKIKAIPAGTTLLVRRAKKVPTPSRYINLAEELMMSGDHGLSSADIKDVIRDAVYDSVKAHMAADVEVGLFLSGGIDSSSLLGVIRDVGVTGTQCLTLGFKQYLGSANDEVPIASDVARTYEATHAVSWVEQSDFEVELPRILGAMDQPSIDGVNMWFVAKAARAHGLKVALTGLGADEMLAGYPSFRQVPRTARLVGRLRAIPTVPGPLNYVSTLIGRLLRRPKVAGVMEYGGTLAGAYMLRRCIFLPEEVLSLLDTELATEGLDELDAIKSLNESISPDPGNDVARVSAMELSTYTRNQLVRDADWAGMAHSVEVRTPFLDIQFLRRVASVMPQMKGGSGKQALAASPSIRLPLSVTTRAKTGFTVPTGRWMSGLAVKSRLEFGVKPASSMGSVSRDWAQFVSQHYCGSLHRQR